MTKWSSISQHLIYLKPFLSFNHVINPTSASPSHLHFHYLEVEEKDGYISFVFFYRILILTLHSNNILVNW